MPRYKKIWIAFFSIFILSSLLFLLHQNQNIKELEVIFFDVGQGDAILIRTPAHKNIIIDGGPDNTLVYKLGRYLPWSDRSILLMLLSHPHADHLTGFNEVITRYKVSNVFTTGITHTTNDYIEMLRLISDNDIPTHRITSQGIIYQEVDFSLEVLYPLADLRNQDVENLNNTSIVLMLRYGEVKILFTGDLESDYQNIVTANTSPNKLRADIIKVSHHGSSDGLNNTFLDAVRPELAVISVGQGNLFNHPSIRTVRALERIGASVRTTQDYGDIIVRSDGQSWWTVE